MFWILAQISAVIINLSLFWLFKDLNVRANLNFKFLFVILHVLKLNSARSTNLLLIDNPFVFNIKFDRILGVFESRRVHVIAWLVIHIAPLIFAYRSLFLYVLLRSNWKANWLSLVFFLLLAWTLQIHIYFFEIRWVLI